MRISIAYQWIHSGVSSTPSVQKNLDAVVCPAPTHSRVPQDGNGTAAGLLPPVWCRSYAVCGKSKQGKRRRSLACAVIRNDIHLSLRSELWALARLDTLAPLPNSQVGKDDKLRPLLHPCCLLHTDVRFVALSRGL